MAQVEPLAARRIAVLADCHIHPGGGPDWTPKVLAALDGVDAILTLGDMGETAGLDRLAQIAPVLGVIGMDDAPDPRAAGQARAFEIGGKIVGLVFDPVAAGLATATTPLVSVPDWRAKAEALFGGPIDVLLHASTHKGSVTEVDGVLVVDPGSALLPQDCAASFARLTTGEAGVAAELIRL